MVFNFGMSMYILCSSLPVVLQCNQHVLHIHAQHHTFVLLLATDPFASYKLYKAHPSFFIKTHKFPYYCSLLELLLASYQFTTFQIWTFEVCDTDFDGIFKLDGKFSQHISFIKNKFVIELQSIFCDIGNWLGHNLR